MSPLRLASPSFSAGSLTPETPWENEAQREAGLLHNEYLA